MDGGERHHQSLYNIQLGMRYHMHRQAFFERCHRFVGITSLIGGSASVAALVGTHGEVALIASAVIAISQSIDLIVDSRKYAQLHDELRRRYCLLEPELLDRTTLTEAEYKEIWTKIKAIEVDEPPPKNILLGICQDDLNDVLNYTENEAPRSYSRPGVFKRAIAQFW